MSKDFVRDHHEPPTKPSTNRVPQPGTATDITIGQRMAAPDGETQLALALVRRLSKLLGIRAVEPSVIDAPTFDLNGYHLGNYPVSSLEMIEFAVVLETELGFRLLDPDALAELSTIRRLAQVVVLQADPLAVRRFCDAR
jgi:hypothetical protein